MIWEAVQLKEPAAMGGTRTEAVMTTVRQRIAGRGLAHGAKLPSIRKLALTLNVSPSTVVEAYERLVAEGAIHSRPGSGFYAASPTTPQALSETGPRVDRVVDPFWVSRQALELKDDLLKPGCGWLPPDWLPEASIRKALRALSRASGAILADYGSPHGLPPLRKLIVRRMAERGTDCPPDQIVLTESGTQAMDLVCRFLLEPGDTVIVDDPAISTSRPYCAPIASNSSARPTHHPAQISRRSRARSPNTGRASTSPIRPSTIRQAPRCRPSPPTGCSSSPKNLR